MERRRESDNHVVKNIKSVNNLKLNNIDSKTQFAINNKQLVLNCSIERANVHTLLSFSLSLFLLCALGSEREEGERLHVGVAPHWDN